jgi:uncharacterized protein (TIGR02145 family)
LPVNGEYATLRTALAWGSSGANVISSAWRGLYTGFNGSSYQGVYARYWSATAYDASNAYAMHFTSDNYVNPSIDVAKSYQHSVRCLAR